MQPRKFALYGGIVMVLIGLAALIPSLSSYTGYLPPLRLDTSYGFFLGLFAMNICNKIALIVAGLIGIGVASLGDSAERGSVFYSRTLFVLAGLLAIAGILPWTNTLYGTWPLFGNMIWFDGVIALIAAYFGFNVGFEREPSLRRDNGDFRTPLAGTR